MAWQEPCANAADIRQVHRCENPHLSINPVTPALQFQGLQRCAVLQRIADIKLSLCKAVFGAYHVAPFPVDCCGLLLFLQTREVVQQRKFVSAHLAETKYSMQLALRYSTVSPLQESAEH